MNMYTYMYLYLYMYRCVDVDCADCFVCVYGDYSGSLLWESTLGVYSGSLTHPLQGTSLLLQGTSLLLQRISLLRQFDPRCPYAEGCRSTR